MHRLAYLLILLVFSRQPDAAAAVALGLPAAPLTVDDDEYLPSQRRAQEEECSPLQKSVFVGHQPQTEVSPLVRRGEPPEWTLSTPFTPPPLLVFMSLQI